MAHRADILCNSKVDHYEAIEHAEYVKQQADKGRRVDWFLAVAYLDLLRQYEERVDEDKNPSEMRKSNIRLQLEVSNLKYIINQGNG